MIFVFVLSLLLPISVSASFDISLKYGSRGDAVIELQDFLQDQGFLKGNADGRFGLSTRKAVIDFQVANGLKGDGYFGLGSRTRAEKILNKTLEPSLQAELIENTKDCEKWDIFSKITGKPCRKETLPTNTPPTIQKPIVTETPVLPNKPPEKGSVIINGSTITCNRIESIIHCFDNATGEIDKSTERKKGSVIIDGSTINCKKVKTLIGYDYNPETLKADKPKYANTSECFDNATGERI